MCWTTSQGSPTHSGIVSTCLACFLLISVEVKGARGVLVADIVLGATQVAIEGVKSPPRWKMFAVAEPQVPPARKERFALSWA